MEELEIKIKESFPQMAVLKSSATNVFSFYNIPLFIKDWVIMKYADKDGNIDPEFLKVKMPKILPKKEEWPLLLDKLINEKQDISFLAKIKVKTNISSGEITFTLPDLDLTNKDTIIFEDVWKSIKTDNLSSGEECWGVVTLRHVEYKKSHKIGLVGFKIFKPYNVNAEYYAKVRESFSLDEWIDVVLGAMNYNGKSFKTFENKFEMLKRLIPFVEKRTNLIELAPKGTGKSYVFSQISKFGWLNSGGVVSRAKLFYDMSTKQVGLLGNYDYVALDEISTIKFTDMAEIQGSLKCYLESGTFAVGTKMNSSDAGMIFLGNISINDMDVNKVMTKSLPDLFNDSALLDRIHGFIKGWDVPRMDESLKMKGWGLNTEYFAEILHLLRNDSSYMSVVDGLLQVTSGDTRDVTSIKRLCSAFIKLLFPHWNSIDKVNKEEFKKYCLDPAIEMRTIIKKQLALMDNEFASRPFPEFQIVE